MPKLIVMLRVKDGIFFAREWLSCYEKLVDEIVVLDNGSTDGTYEILAAHPLVTGMIATTDFNEGRDKNALYDLMRTKSPDWCLWVDIDEIFEPHVTRRTLDRMMRTKVVNKFAFRRFHFIDRENFAGSKYWLNYSAGHDRIMWREQATGHFADLIIDSPNVKGISGIKWNTNLRIKHTGYINKALVDRKAAIYRDVLAPEKIDSLQTMYLHNERKILWIDNPRHLKVILLNALLNFLLIKHKIPSGLRKLRSLLYQKTSRNTAFVR